MSRAGSFFFDSVMFVGIKYDHLSTIAGWMK